MALSYQGSSLADCCSVVTIQCSESTRQLIAEASKKIEVLEFIGYLEMSSGCGVKNEEQKAESYTKLHLCRHDQYFRTQHIKSMIVVPFFGDKKLQELIIL